MRCIKEQPEFVRITAFGHVFEVLPGLAEDLVTLEKEGAIYSDFWDSDIQEARFYRIPLLPPEIFQYVEAHVAMQQFRESLSAGAPFEEALNAISNQEIAKRVYSYGDFGSRKLKDGTTIDNRGCFASFCPPELELLLCGARKDRYELLPDLNHANTTALLLGMLEHFPALVGHLATRKHGRPPFLVENEYEVQDLLYVCARAVFRDARLEEWTPKHGGSAKRVDILIPSIDAIIETKFVRSSKHALSMGDEIKVDIESYHTHPRCNELLVFVWDPHLHVVDTAPLSDDLSGRRVKGERAFNVTVLVRR
jgi:hypothetical protein